MSDVAAPTLSVIVPVHNHAQYVGEGIESVAAQTPEINRVRALPPVLAEQGCATRKWRLNAWPLLAPCIAGGFDVAGRATFAPLQCRGRAKGSTATIETRTPEQEDQP